MKVLIIAPSAYLLGGVQDWLYMLTLGLRKKGYQINVAVPNNVFHNGIVYNEYYGELNAIFFSNKTGTPEGRIRALSQLLIKNPSDLILGVNIGDVYEAYRRVFSHLNNTRLAMTLHAIEGDYLGDIGRYYPLLDGVIVTNRLSEKLVGRLNLIEEDRIFYAPYGVNVNNVRLSKSTHNRLSIAWVGRLDVGQKRICDLQNILKSLDQRNIPYILSIAGDGPCRADLERELHFWIRAKKVRVYGFLDKKSLTEFYSVHNTLLITSEWETGPIVAWEAMISGLAIVSSEYTGHLSEGALVNEETALLFPIGSNEQAANQFGRLLNTDYRLRLAKKGQDMAISRYSLDSSLNSWEKAIQTILYRRRRKQGRKLQSHSADESNRLESIVGTKVSELLRLSFRRKGYCRDPGSEWPHSLYGHTNQKALLKYAKTLEENA